MNTFGTVYMSTVGCGIVYMELNDGSGPIETTTTTSTTTTTGDTTTTTTNTTTSTTTSGQIDDDVYYGDLNLDNTISMIDIVYLNKYIAGVSTLNEQQEKNANCYAADTEINAQDSTALMNRISQAIDSLPVF